MKLLFVQETFWPSIGGIQVLSLRALVALRERGYEPTVIATFAGEDLPERDEVNGITVYRLPFRRSLEGRDLDAVIRCRNEYARLKNEICPDMVQLNFSGPSGFFLLATAAPDDPPLVVAVRHPLGEIDGEGTLVSRLLRSATWVTGNSQATLDGALKAAPDIESRCSVILNGLEAPTRPLTRLPLAPPELLFLGRLVREKGCHVAVEAFRLIRESIPQARLTIAGDGPERPALQRQVRKLGLDDAVSFVGWVSPDAVPEVIDRAAVVLMPSREESFGLVALECGLMGRPVVASRVGGLPEVVRHGETGFVVPRDDPEAFARAAARLLSDPDRATCLGNAARARSLTTFTLERYVDEYDALYRRLAGRSNAQRKAG